MLIEDMTTIRNFKHLLDYSVSLHPQMTFLEYKTDEGIQKKTYSELKKNADALSFYLKNNGFEGAHISILGPSSYNWISAFLGIVNSGSVVVPLSPAETDDMNKQLIDFSDSSVFMFDKKHFPLYERIKNEVPAVKLFISIDDLSENREIKNISDIFENNNAEYNEEPDSEAVCAIMFTSGTTGFPKGVQLTHKNFIYAGTSVYFTLPAERMLACLPMNHAFGITGLLTKTLVLNRTLCLNDELKNIAYDLKLYKPNTLLGVPQIIKFFFSSAFKYAETKAGVMTENDAIKEFFGGEMISMFCGGAPLEAEINARYNDTGIHVLNGYGMTECAPVVSNCSEQYQKHGSVGKPIPCMSVKTDNGEILLKGPNIMKGYYKNPEATNAAFTKDGWFRTGDLGYLDDEGYLYITGRCKNLILLDSGENVSAEYLEEKLRLEPLIKECICFSENGAIYAEIYPNKDYMEKRRVKSIEAEMPELLMRVNKNLALYQHISGYIIRDTPFPKTSSAKIKRNLPHSTIQLKKREEPKNEAEQRVYDAVKIQLNIENISMTDNYFAIGGDSLSAVELALSLNIEPQAVYDNPFLSSLAKILNDEESLLSRADDINALIKNTKTDEKARPYKCVLLTGATGFLGIHILKELVDNNLRVYCLVRNPRRLVELIKYYFGHINLDNVKTISGNIEDKSLGLSDSELTKLANEVDVVFHTAANVRHAGDYSELERTNVIGTKNIIEFCKKASAVLQHTSTVSVHGAATVRESTENAVFDEDILDIGQTYTDNVYIHSKYCAEEAVISARREGLKANIFRIGNLTWRSSDGKFQINSEDNGFLHRIHAKLKLGIWHDGMEKYPMDLTPVDECANAYVRLALSGALNRIYHIYNQNYLDQREMFDLLSIPYRVASTTEMIETAEANLDDRDIHVYVFYIIISAKSSEIDVRNKKTVEELRNLGFCWSKPDRRYLTLPSPEAPRGQALNFEPVRLRSMRKTGEVLSSIGRLTLGAMKKTKPKHSEILRGTNSLSLLKEKIVKKGLKKPFVITIPFPLKSVDDFIFSFGSDAAVFRNIKAEPTVGDTEKALSAYLKNGCDCVVGIGGGSVIDTAKITALRVANPHRSLNDVAKLDSSANDCAPLFIAPTTAGTGSEVTLFAMAVEEEKNKKRPFVTDKFLPDIVVLDPVLTLSVPPLSTAYTGIDALSHAVESYLSLFAQSFPEDAEFAPKACRTIFENLENACRRPNDIKVRQEMQDAAYNAGISFRRISTGYIHAISHRLGEFYHIPHGLAIAAVFTSVLKAYLPFGAEELAALAFYCNFGKKEASKEENALIFIHAIDDLIKNCDIDISSIPFDKKDVSEIARKAQEEAKLIGYPRPFSDKELQELIISIFKK